MNKEIAITRRPKEVPTKGAPPKKEKTSTRRGFLKGACVVGAMAAPLGLVAESLRTPRYSVSEAVELFADEGFLSDARRLSIIYGEIEEIVDESEQNDGSTMRALLTDGDSDITFYLLPAALRRFQRPKPGTDFFDSGVVTQKELDQWEYHKEYIGKIARDYVKKTEVGDYVEILIRPGCWKGDYKIPLEYFNRSLDKRLELANSQR